MAGQGRAPALRLAARTRRRWAAKAAHSLATWRDLERHTAPDTTHRERLEHDNTNRRRARAGELVRPAGARAGDRPMSAIISACGVYRYRLEREVQPRGIVVAYFGVNGSTADATQDDQTVRKWAGFTQRHGGRRMIVGNAFAYRATDVGELARAHDPIGPDNDAHLARIIADADILVPCWGRRSKLPGRLHDRLDQVAEHLFGSGKPVMILGLTRSGDPVHPLMLAYATRMVPWQR